MRGIHGAMVKSLLDKTLLATGLADDAGVSLRFTPHDFRRMFITDAIMNGPPPHIAQVIAGHENVETTMRYKAVYPEEAIEAYRAFIARRRSERPSAEYRTPTEAEWDDFLAHFEKRNVPSASVPAPFQRLVFTSTPVSDVHSFGRIRHSATALKRSATTCATGSPRLSAKAGSARSKDFREALPAPTTRSIRLIGHLRGRRWTWACRGSADPWAQGESQLKTIIKLHLRRCQMPLRHCRRPVATKVVQPAASGGARCPKT
ncbi:tyrosine-type recombinase/integrase [Streptomyces xanthophaeus]